MLQTSTFWVLLLGAALGAGLMAVLPAWRRLAGHGLPVWRFLGRRGVDLERPAALQAEIRCALCASQAKCQHLLAAGAEAPPASCPNAALFEEKASSRAGV